MMELQLSLGLVYCHGCFSAIAKVLLGKKASLIWY
jgi:hypothetical protein